MRFGEKATAYAENAPVQRAVAHWLAEWIDETAGDMTAIEFGAGPGLFTEYLVRAGCHQLLATDASERMVSVGSQRLPQIDWKVVDAWAPRVSPVDRIYSCSLLQWATDPAAALKEWRRALRPGGRILVALFVEGSMRELLRVEPSIQAFPWRSEGEWKASFGGAGFELVRSSVWEERCFFPSAIEALRSVHSIGAIREGRFGAGALRRVLKGIDEACEGSNGVPVSWKALRIEAKAI